MSERRMPCALLQQTSQVRPPLLGNAYLEAFCCLIGSEQLSFGGGSLIRAHNGGGHAHVTGHTYMNASKAGR